MAGREREKNCGLETLGNAGLISIIIRGAADDSLAEAASLDVEKKFSGDFSMMTPESLSEIDSLCREGAMKLLAARELFRRSGVMPAKVTGPADAVKLVSDIIRRRQEHFIVITLNGAGCLIQRRTVFVGTVNRSLVHPREIFADAISDRASGIILMHNHPSGELNPSREDVLTTEKLLEGAKILGIEILDHVIFSSKGYYSFKENGKL